jgi:beta-glucanase (GH16 family)
MNLRTITLATAVLFGSAMMMADAASCLDDSAIWCDEFNTPGVPNPEYWGYDLGAGGWGNKESQTYDAANAVVEDDGHLHIKVTREGVDFTSARMKTEDKVSFLYVRMEASIRIPDLTGGLWPAIWMLGINFADIGWPRCGEIDIAEWGSLAAIGENRLQATASSAIHWDENGHVYDTDEITVDTPPSLDEEFHVYAVDWTPTEIAFFLDDVQIFSKNTTDLEEFHEPVHILLNVAVGGDFTGIFTPTSQGGELLVDWVRVYDNGFGSNVTVAPCGEDSDEDDSSAAFSIIFGWCQFWSIAGLAILSLLNFL